MDILQITRKLGLNKKKAAKVYNIAVYTYNYTIIYKTTESIRFLDVLYITKNGFVTNKRPNGYQTPVGVAKHDVILI